MVKSVVILQTLSSGQTQNIQDKFGRHYFWDP